LKILLKLGDGGRTGRSRTKADLLCNLIEGAFAIEAAGLIRGRRCVSG
jgi:hypothetical protein